MSEPHQNPWTFDFARMDTRVAAVQIRAGSAQEELGTHQHAQGQAVLVLRGNMTCEVPGALWLVPVQGGLWIPGGVPHSNRLARHGNACFLFLSDSFAAMPDSCCTFAVTPLLRELVIHLAALPSDQQHEEESDRVRAVVIDQLARMPLQTMHLPVSDGPRLRPMIDAMTQDPSDRKTTTEWASLLAMSERTFSRLMLSETGMTFGRWRQRLQLIVAVQWLSCGVAVQTVASNLGYDTPSAFIKMFKAAMGKPPGLFVAKCLSVDTSSN